MAFDEQLPSESEGYIPELMWPPLSQPSAEQSTASGDVRYDPRMPRRRGVQKALHSGDAVRTIVSGYPCHWTGDGRYPKTCYAEKRVILMSMSLG